MSNVKFLVLILVQCCLAFGSINQDLVDFALNPKNVIQKMIANLSEESSLCQIHSQVYFGHLETATDLLLPQNTWALKSKFCFANS